MQWACILLPQLAMDGVLRRLEVPDGAAIALVDGPVQRRTLHSVTPAARMLGLRPGQSLAAAQALSTHFRTFEHDAAQVERWRALLAAWAYRFSSQVSTELPHALLLEVGHSLQLFGPWPRLEARMRAGSGIASWLRPIRMRRGRWRTCMTGSRSMRMR